VRFSAQSSGESEVVCRAQDAHTPPGVEHDKIVVAADDGFCSGRKGKLQVFIVLWIAAVGDAPGRLEPESRVSEDIKEMLTPPERNCLNQGIHPVGILGGRFNSSAKIPKSSLDIIKTGRLDSYQR
jgi:hypothetical protein